ncbi:NAD-dependent epimerase/dehydratase family protein [Acanthopleuribacter pedis]|uniref:GDP-mannose 4,6-dehydratase n=1 Tax=Acanthopleuribacter pedis TaxID=442870 RepID=A0A8J7Q3T8_9BACT|nr:NAD-dependent epimerase/dehydratase family protein [Acanthopleuribacter pedis]MBO1317829.1 GDP-mannose 4,6-dehydratase [Acanthopleuribacter pedis]
MNILVTGVAGFIGSHITEKLLQEGHEVFGIDNLNDYYSPQLKHARLQRLQRYENGQIENFDIVDTKALKAAFQRFRPDLVLHLAAQVGVRYSIENPAVYGQSNLVGFLNILECCRAMQVDRLVYASSSSVYGGNPDLPYSEKQSVDHPVSLYAATKKANELMAHSYTHLYGLQTIGLRFFTVYGPWGRPDMAVWLFSQAILQNKPIQIYNHGDMARDFTYIDDIVAGIHAALFRGGLDPYEIFNLGNHQREKLMHLVGCIEEAMGRKAEKELMPMQAGDMKETYADIENARAKLGFEPQTELGVGIRRFVSWLLANPQFHGF